MFKTPKEPIFDLKPAEHVTAEQIHYSSQHQNQGSSKVVAQIRVTKQALNQKLAFQSEHQDLEPQDRELLQRCIEQDRKELEQWNAEAQKQLDETNRALVRKTKLLAILNNQMDQPDVKDLANQIRRLTEYRDSFRI